MLTVPLFSPERGRIEGRPSIHLSRTVPITPDEAQVVQQIAVPLQVALEREVIYRTIEAERQRAYQRSIRDPLTGLFTRVYMLDAVERHCSIHDRDASAPVAAVMVDMDHFKRVNDTYGHAAGDEVLKQVAEVLRGTCERRTSRCATAARSSSCSWSGPRPRRGRVCRAHPHRHCGPPVRPGSGSVTARHGEPGVAQRHQCEPLDSLIRRADEALYRAKEGGRNRVEVAGTPSPSIKRDTVTARGQTVTRIQNPTVTVGWERAQVSLPL